ncbi:hypothetical protein OQA88_9183 [Cercophora sp. LCS_1]
MAPALVDTDETKEGLVLLTGGSGFIASHVLQQLLVEGHRVIFTARSKPKASAVLAHLPPSLHPLVSSHIVEDISSPTAFDTLLQSHPFTHVIHTASPYQLTFANPITDCLDPAIKGTTSLLRSIATHCFTVRRVVITSSSAAILSPPNHLPVYNETCWSDVTLEQAMDPAHTYRASKKFAEKAAWDFVASEKPNFDLATINNTYTFGPIGPSPGELNTSNQRILNAVTGKWKDGVEPTAPVFTFVDVRDVAVAHVRAMTLPEAGGKRFYVVGEYFSNPKIAGIIRENFPELRDRLPEETADDFPEGHWKFDNARSREVLGLGYKGLEESVVDTVRSILERLKK